VYDLAWSVSLAASGQVYASTGGSGSVTMHSTAYSDGSKMEEGESVGFGSRLADISTGRSKFGLFVDHCPSDDNKIAMSNESGQVCRESCIITCIYKLLVVYTGCRKTSYSHFLGESRYASPIICVERRWKCKTVPTLPRHKLIIPSS
jgi:hypothetical protein